MSKEVMKSYDLEFNTPYINQNIDQNSTTMNFNLSFALETISEKFSKQIDETLIDWLYTKYKGTDVSKVYVLSEEEFKDFLIKMLPKYRGDKNEQEGN